MGISGRTACVATMSLVIIMLIAYSVYMTIVNNKSINEHFLNVCNDGDDASEVTSTDASTNNVIIRDPKLDSAMRHEYYNNGVRYVFTYDLEIETTTHYELKCRALKCQNACDLHYNAENLIAPFSLCIDEYDYCQCLRYTELLKIPHCETYNCNVNCYGSGHDYGVCNYNDDGCYCFKTINFRDESSKARWEKIVEYYLIKRLAKVKLLDLSG